MAFEYVFPQQQPMSGVSYYRQPEQEQESPFSRIKPQNIQSAIDMFKSGGGGGAGALSGAGGGGGVAALQSTGGAAGVSSGSMGPVAGLYASEAAAGTGGSAYLSGAGTAAGSGAGSAAGGLGSAASAAGPWAALAAIIYLNESKAIKEGKRSEDKGEYAKDLFSGEVFHQDMEQRWLPKLGLKEGSKANETISTLSNPMGFTGDLGKTWGRLKGLFS